MTENKYKQIHHGRVPEEDVTKFKDMYTQGKKIEEIAQATGWSGVTIRNYVHEGKPKREYKRQYVNHVTGERYHTRETEQVSNLRGELHVKTAEIKELGKTITKSNQKLDKAERELISLRERIKLLEKNAQTDRTKINDLSTKLNDKEREMSDKTREFDAMISKIKVEGHLTKSLQRKVNNDTIKRMEKDGVIELYKGKTTDGGDRFVSLAGYVM